MLFGRMGVLLHTLAYYLHKLCNELRILGLNAAFWVNYQPEHPVARDARTFFSSISQQLQCILFL